MRDIYRTGYLTKEQIERAYVLVSAFAPTIAPAAWRKFCLASLSSMHDSRVATVEDPSGYVRAAAVFALRQDIGGDKWLDVPLFAPLSAADSRRVARAMLAFLDRVARQSACPAVRFRSLQADKWHRYIAGDAVAGDDGVTMMLAD